MYIYAAFRWAIARLLERRCRLSDGKVTNITPVSLLEVKVERYVKVIFGDELDAAEKYNPAEMAVVPKVRLGEGTLGALFKVVLGCGSTVTMRKIRAGCVRSDDLEFWIRFFGGLCDVWILKIEFSVWYGGEGFVLYEYLCLGSLEELLHGETDTTFSLQFSPSNPNPFVCHVN